jgi:hypothetical protein
VQAVDRGRCLPQDAALDLARPLRRNQLATERTQQRLCHGRAAKRPQAAQAANRPAQEGVARETPDELGMVVVEPEREAHPLDGFLARRLDDDRAVGPLARFDDLELAVDLVDGAETAAPGDARRVAAEPGRESKGVGAARSERGLDQLRLCACGEELSCAARSRTSSASDSRPALRR